MNGKRRRILAAVFTHPVSGTIAWDGIENPVMAVGCRVVGGGGSRVRFVFGAEVETFHRPHPEKEAKRYQVRAARDSLTRIGVTP